jgi:hypothetical protein
VIVVKFPGGSRFTAKVRMPDQNIYLRSKRSLFKFLQSFDEKQDLDIIIHSPKYFSTITIRYRPDASPKWDVGECLYDPEVAREYGIVNASRQLFYDDCKDEIIRYLSKIL